MLSIHIIFASTSGHTEYVAGVLAESLKAKKIASTVTGAELAKPEDFAKADLLILASSTWNTGNVEGQLNPHMDALLRVRAKAVQLSGKKVALIALGDSRYRYQANAAVHMEEFVKTHGGVLAVPTLKVVNEPYGQEMVVKEWGRKLLENLTKNYELGIRN